MTSTVLSQRSHQSKSSINADMPNIYMRSQSTKIKFLKISITVSTHHRDNQLDVHYRKGQYHAPGDKADAENVRHVESLTISELVVIFSSDWKQKIIVMCITTHLIMCI